MGKPSFHGAARQFGSGALRNPEDPTLNKIHHEKQEKLRERDERERFRFDDASVASIGVVVSHVKPPGYNSRTVGKTPITHHSGISHDVFRSPGNASTQRLTTSSP